MDSSRRQAEISFFDDMIRRNAATIKYLALWGINVVSNILPNQSTIDGLSQVNDEERQVDENDEENDEKDIVDYEPSYGHFVSSVCEKSIDFSFPTMSF